MDDRRFWSLIAAIDVPALRGGDEEGAVGPLVVALAKLPPGDIEGFAESLAQKLYALDGERFAREAGASGESADGFLYARCHVVASGRARYQQVLATPAQMSKSIDDWCEALLSVAERAYGDATGEPWEFVASVSYETGSNHAQWP